LPYANPTEREAAPVAGRTGSHYLLAMRRGGVLAVVLGAVVTATTLAMGGVGPAAVPAGADLPSKLSASQFYKLVSKADPLRGPSQSQFTASFDLGSGESMTEGFKGHSNPKNGEETLSTYLSITSPQGTGKLESIGVECFHESCYTNGNVIGIPVVGETGAKWLGVTVPKVAPIYNPFTALAKRFAGSVHETKLPLSAPHSASAAYLVSGSFSMLQLIEVFGASLPTQVDSLSKNAQDSAALEGITMTFHNALAIVSSTGRLIGLRMPVDISISPSVMSELGSSEAPSNSTGSITGSNLAAPALHLVRPSAAETTTAAAVAQSFKTTPSGNSEATGDSGNTGSGDGGLFGGTTGEAGNSGNTGSADTVPPATIPPTSNSGAGNSGSGSVSSGNSGIGNSGVGNSGAGNSGRGNSGNS
jgi:hypothetical protein